MSNRLMIRTLDGPAGAGKTTFLKHQVDVGLVAPLRSHLQVERPRAYDDEFGVPHAQVKDQLALMEYFFQYDDTGCPIYLDRFGLSGFVYEQIRLKRRNPGATPSQEIFRRYLRDLFQWSYMSLCMLTSRYDALIGHERLAMAPRDYTYVSFHFALLIPDADQISKNRGRSGKVYPYSVGEEINMWNTTYRFLTNLKHEFKRSGYEYTLARLDELSHQTGSLR